MIWTRHDVAVVPAGERNVKLVPGQGLVEKKSIGLTEEGRRGAAAALLLWEVAQGQFVSSFGKRRWAKLRQQLIARA